MRSIRAVLILIALFATLAAFTAQPAAADDNPDTAYAARMFAENAGKARAFACFIRRYDAEHMAQHPLQKVTVMKLLVTAEKTPDDKYLEYSFRLGVNFRDRPGNFDSSGNCGHGPDVRALDKSTTEPVPDSGMDFGCGVDCDGGGINVSLSNKDQSILVKLPTGIRIWKGKDPDESAVSALMAGNDDKIFRLDRTDLKECAPLAYDRQELAAMRHK
jgi:hypothetical protein